MSLFVTYYLASPTFTFSCTILAPPASINGYQRRFVMQLYHLTPVYATSPVYCFILIFNRILTE